jgi:hypothetical protein
MPPVVIPASPSKCSPHLHGKKNNLFWFYALTTRYPLIINGTPKRFSYSLVVFDFSRYTTYARLLTAVHTALFLAQNGQHLDQIFLCKSDVFVALVDAQPTFQALREKTSEDVGILSKAPRLNSVPSTPRHGIWWVVFELCLR